MNTNTAITTAARRLARENNTRYPEITTGYDTDGHPVDAWSTGMTHIGKPPADIAVTLRGTRNCPMTYRAAQDHLDAAAHATAHPDELHAADDYLADLQFARDTAAAR